MTNLELSEKGISLIRLYKKMARKGYERADGSKVEIAFSDFELRFYRNEIRTVLKRFNISTMLDYGSGGSDWTSLGFDEGGQCAKDYFNLSKVNLYDPARNFDHRTASDCVVCFDVLEHIHILDVRKILIDIFSNATKLVIINVACYPANALLPNGENAHVTVRHPIWWKGQLDSVSVEFPNISVLLFCSVGWRKTNSFKIWSANDWASQEGFVVDD